MDHTDADIASAPLPTAKTLRARTSLLIQFGASSPSTSRWRRSSARNTAERSTAPTDERDRRCAPR